MVTVFFGCPVKLELTGFPKVFQFFHVFSTEYFGNDLDWKEKFSAVILPFIFGRQSSAEQYCVDMGMKVHFRTPCMQDADISNRSTKMLGVSSQFTDCSRSSVIQCVIQLLLITVNNRIQDIRNCKYEMEVRCIKHVLSAGIHPHFLWNSLAHGTTTVTAGIIVNLNSTTVFAYTDVCTICPGFAVQDVPSDFCLFWRRRKLFKVCRIKTLENILNGGLIHSPRLLSCQMGFGFP